LGTFNIFNIIKTLQNYFTCELLPGYTSAVQWHLTLCKLVAAMFGGKLFGGSVIDGQWCLCGILYCILLYITTGVCMCVCIFSVAGPRVWNALPSHLRRDINYRHFKHALKGHMFKI